MDRLQALAIVASVAAACGKGDGSEPPPSRVNAVKAAGQASTAGFCDVHHDADRAPAFQLPALASPAPPSPAGWRWINVWATWCKPCVEEMPRLRQWRERLSSGGQQVGLVFLSLDESDQEIARFRDAHPGTDDSLRIADTAALATWLRAIGLDEQASIPIHIFVDPRGRTRCVRAGGVGDDHFATVKQLFAE